MSVIEKWLLLTPAGNSGDYRLDHRLHGGKRVDCTVWLPLVQSSSPRSTAQFLLSPDLGWLPACLCFQSRHNDELTYVWLFSLWQFGPSELLCRLSALAVLSGVLPLAGPFGWWKKERKEVVVHWQIILSLFHVIAWVFKTVTQLILCGNPQRSCTAVS